MKAMKIGVAVLVFMVPVDTSLAIVGGCCEVCRYYKTTSRMVRKRITDSPPTTKCVRERYTITCGFWRLSRCSRYRYVYKKVQKYKYVMEKVYSKSLTCDDRCRPMDCQTDPIMW